MGAFCFLPIRGSRVYPFPEVVGSSEPTSGQPSVAREAVHHITDAEVGIGE